MPLGVPTTGGHLCVVMVISMDNASFVILLSAIWRKSQAASLVLFIQREAPAAHFRYAADDEEAGGVDVVDETLQLGQLAVGDDAEQDGGGLVGVAACAVENGHTPVQLAEDGLAQLLRPLADELDLGAAEG
mgnify:CR=1 FL=1